MNEVNNDPLYFRLRCKKKRKKLMIYVWRLLIASDELRTTNVKNEVAVAGGYFELETRSFDKFFFEFPAFGFVLMKEERKEIESGVGIGAAAVTVTIAYNNNKPTKKLEVRKSYIVHKHKRTCITTNREMRSAAYTKVATVLLREREKDEEKNLQIRKKVEVTNLNLEKPTDSEKSRSDKSRKKTQTQTLHERTKTKRAVSKYEFGLKSKPSFSTQKCDQIKSIEENQSEGRLLSDNITRKRQREYKTDRRCQHLVFDNG